MEQFYPRRVVAYNVSNLTDARYFSARMVDSLVYHMRAHHDEGLSPQEVNAIIEWVQGPENYLHISHGEPKVISELLAHTNAVGIVLDAMLYNDELAGISGEKIIHFPLVEELDDEPWQIVIRNVKKSGFPIILHHHGKQNFVDVYNRYFAKLDQQVYRIVNNVEQLDEIRELELVGIALLGGSEEEVGLKSYQDIDEILDNLESWT